MNKYTKNAQKWVQEYEQEEWEEMRAEEILIASAVSLFAGGFVVLCYSVAKWLALL